MNPPPPPDIHRNRFVFYTCMKSHEISPFDNNKPYKTNCARNSWCAESFVVSCLFLERWKFVSRRWQSGDSPGSFEVINRNESKFSSYTFCRKCENNEIFADRTNLCRAFHVFFTPVLFSFQGQFRIWRYENQRKHNENPLQIPTNDVSTKLQILLRKKNAPKSGFFFIFAENSLGRKRSTLPNFTATMSRWSLLQGATITAARKSFSKILWTLLGNISTIRDNFWPYTCPGIIWPMESKVIFYLHVNFNYLAIKNIIVLKYN